MPLKFGKSYENRVRNGRWGIRSEIALFIAKPSRPAAPLPFRINRYATDYSGGIVVSTFICAAHCNTQRL